MTYNQIPKTGTIGGMVDNINANFQLTKEMLERLEVTKDHAVGLFSTLTALQTAYPSPEVGDWALVGRTSPFDIYKCSTAGTWSDTGGTYDGGTIDLTNYATKEYVDDLVDPIAEVIKGGEQTSEVTSVTWTTGKCIRSDTGAETSPGSSYASSSLITIPHSFCDVGARFDTMMVSYNGSSTLTPLGLAWYDENQSYLSGVKWIEATTGMVEATLNVPSGARYLRTTCRTANTGTWFGTFKKTSGGIVERVDDLEEEIKQVNELAKEAYELASEEQETTHDVYVKDDDPTTTGTANTARYGIGFYTPKFTEEEGVKFNNVVVKNIKASANVTVQWRVYAYNGTTAGAGTDDQPSAGTIGNNHTLLASGTVDVGTDVCSVSLDFNETTCPSGSQVLIYLLTPTTDTTLVIVKPSGTLPSDTHGTIYNAGGTWSDTWNIGYSSNGYAAYAPILRWLSPFTSREDVQEMIDEALEDIDIKTPDWKIILPNTIHVLVGGEINLWDDGISLPLDNGLKSPLNYSVQWTASMSDVMRRHPRGARIRPTQAGAFTLTCRMYTNDGESLIDEKAIKIVAVEKNALSAAKNIVCIGSSSCPGTTQYIDEILSDSSRYTGTKPTFWGTLTTQGVKHEGHGGWKWSQFWGSASVSSVTNPLYDSSVGHASASYYRNTLGMGSAKFDLVLFQLGLNDFVQLIGSTPKTVAEYRSSYTMQSSVLPAMKNLVEEFLADNPDCKIILALPYICNNSGGHSTTATYASLEFAKASYAMRLEYLSFLETHPSVILSAGHQMIDRWYGFVMDSYMTSASSYKAFQQTDIRPHDIIHCGIVGYRQYAEGFAASIIAALGTTSETETSCGYDTTDVIAQNVNPASQGGSSAVDQTARDAAAAAQTTANTANTTANAAQTTANEANAKKAVAQFDSILDGTTPTPMEGDETVNCSIVVYAEGDKRFYGKTSSASSSFYAKWNGYKNYVDTTNSNKPHGDRVYRCADNGVSYIFAEDELQRIDDGAYSLASAALPASTIWSGTQAQYDALTAAQKAAVIAFIEEE